MSKIVLPGDKVGSTYDLDSGPGTFVVGSDIVASLAGEPVVLPALPASSAVSRPSIGAQSASGSSALATASMKGMIAVQRPNRVGSGTSILPDVGDEVLGRVSKADERQCRIEILVVRGLAVKEPLQAVLRKENVRAADIDRVRLEECFRPGDVVKAQVASMGDARTYQLTTVGTDLGVIHAEAPAETATRAGLAADAFSSGLGLATKGSFAPRGASLAPGGASLVAVSGGLMVEPTTGSEHRRKVARGAAPPAALRGIASGTAASGSGSGESKPMAT